MNPDHPKALKAAALENLAKLECELSRANARLSDIEAEATKLRQRICALNDSPGYRNSIPGEIERARDAAEIAGKPILEGETHYYNKTILSVDAKWIVTNAGTYRRDNGWRKNTRSPYDTIDATKALALWAEYERQMNEVES